jgi:hypothetical protein
MRPLRSGTRAPPRQIKMGVYAQKCLSDSCPSGGRAATVARGPAGLPVTLHLLSAVLTLLSPRLRTPRRRFSQTRCRCRAPPAACVFEGLADGRDRRLLLIPRTVALLVLTSLSHELRVDVLGARCVIGDLVRMLLYR